MTCLQFELLSVWAIIPTPPKSNLFWRLQTFASVNSCRLIIGWKAFHYPLISLSFSFSSMVVLINRKQIFAESSRAIVCERSLFWSGFGIRCKEDVIIKVVWDQKSVFFISQSGTVKGILFFFRHKSVSLNCVSFSDTLNVHFLISLYFLMYSDTPQFSWGPDRKERNGKHRQLENW